MDQPLNLAVLLPELVLTVGAMALLMLGVITRRERGELVLWLSVAVLAVAGVLVASGEGTETLFHGSFIVDPYGRLLKLLTLTGAAVGAAGIVAQRAMLGPAGAVAGLVPAVPVRRQPFSWRPALRG